MIIKLMYALNYLHKTFYLHETLENDHSRAGYHHANVETTEHYAISTSCQLLVMPSIA